jgi:hypothetical protein
MRVAVATLLLTLALGAPAMAGGWAVTTLDQLPPDMRAAQTYAIGYTIRQHGVTPVNISDFGGTTEIYVTSPDGAKSIKYPGKPEGPVGHYVAQVIFPYEGSWTWRVTQGPFQAQELGAIKIAAPGTAAAPAQPAAPVAAAAPASAPQPSGPNGLLLAALLLASAGAAVLFGTRLAVFADRRTARA